MNRIIVFFLGVFAVLGIAAQSGVSHQPFDELLQKYVDESGLVNYKGLKTERPKLKSYLRMLEANEPKDAWSKDQQLSYWINAYNAFTLELILTHYPVESIKDIGAAIKIPFVNTPWDIKFIKIGDDEKDLNNIEHGIIRKEFEEPRIHFALVCAAFSCPKLQNKAYFPETLDAQLTDAAKDFLADPTKNEIKSSSEAELSKLFSWYRGDFTKKTSLEEFISKYSEVKLDKGADLDYKDYNWDLNEQKPQE
ncbi:MAG: DUF547 domain-containing protein [Cyclobacteriaceae bacterium]